MKRFTDAAKWTDPWFRNLTPSGKIFWIFLLDNCDNAGIWERDDAFFKFVSGIDVEVDAHLEELADRIVVLDECRVLVPKFVLFQQGGELKESKPFHRGILKILDKHGFEHNGDGRIRQSNAISMAKESHTDGIPMPTSLGKGNGNGKGKVKKEIPEELNVPEFRKAWEDYLTMRRQNKWATLKEATLQAKFEEFIEHGVEESVRALKQSVRQGWRGIFPGKDRKDSKHLDNDRNYDDPV